MSPPRPKVPFIPSNIPAKLKSLPNWVCWQFQWKEDKQKWAKVPVSPITGYGASSKNPKHWGTFEQAADFLLEDPRLSGVGFVFSKGCGVFGIDVDGARPDEATHLNDTAKAVLEGVLSYTEWSPSKRGFHILAEGELPGPGFCNMQTGVEMYDDARFFTVTGDVFHDPDTPGLGQLLRPAAELVTRLYDQFRTGASGSSDASLPDMPEADPDHPVIPADIAPEIEHGVHPSDRHGGDHSKAYFTLTRDLARQGWTPAQILFVLSDPANGISTGALRRRNDSVVSARHWLWQYNIAPALATLDQQSIDHLFTHYEADTQPDTHYEADTQPDTHSDPIPAKPKGLLFHTPATIGSTYQPMRHLIRDVVALRSASIVVSPPNVGKSALALDLALAVATGRPWSAHHREVNQGPVLFIAAESPRSIIQRMEALRNTNDTLPADAPIMVTDFRIDLSTPGARDNTSKQLAEMFRHSTALYGRPPVLIIVDTLGRAAPSIDENSFEDMGGLTDWLLRQAHDPKSIEAHWMVLHHTGKDVTKGARGHSSITGNFDTEIHLTRNEDTSSKQITMSFFKQRDLPGKQQEFHYHIESWLTGHLVPDFGHPETAAVAVHDLSKETTNTEHERLVAKESIRNSIATVIPTHGHLGLSACAQAAGVTPEKFKDALEKWNAEAPGAILVDYGAGSNGRNVYRLGEAGTERAEMLGLELTETQPSPPVKEDLASTQLRYLNAVAERGQEGTGAVASYAGVARQVALEALEKFEKRGLVTRTGGGKAGYKYELTSKGQEERQ